MLPYCMSKLPLDTGAPHRPADRPSAAAANSNPASTRRHTNALTLVEVMVSLTLLATVMCGFISTFLQSRRMTEGSVLQSASTSMVWGLIEQLKGLDYTTLVPSYAVDPYAPTTPASAAKTPPYIRLRINQDLTTWIMVRHTQVSDADPTPKAPLTCPAPDAAASSVGTGGAIDNFLGSIPLSTVTGTRSQQLALNIWMWIDEIPDTTKDVSDIKRITVVYTYSYLDGSVTRTIRDMEVFLRSRYDQ